MKQVVNGQEVDLIRDGAEINRLSDRLMVRSASGSASAVAVRQGDETWISYRGRVYKCAKPGLAKSGPSAHSGEIHAPMPGQIVDVLAASGDDVTKGQKLLVLEAMKTQQPIVAPFDGKVKALPVKKSDQVTEGALLVHVVPVEG